MTLGMTLGKVIVKTYKSEFQHGLLYTACSRVKSDDDLAFIGHRPRFTPNRFHYPDIQR